ncbi:MAG: SCP2 sterol-binding domain-containing protein [Candidatus Thorarchaeota archaeon]
MNSSNNQKSTIQALNSHLITALLSLFTSGTLLILVGLFYGLEILKIVSNTELMQSLIVVAIILGVILIGLGVLESLGIIKKIKKVIDILINKGDVGLISTPTITESSGIVSGLKIIRPVIPKNDIQSQIREKPAAPITIATRLEPKVKQSAKLDQEKTKNQVDISLEEGLQMIIDRYNDPKVSKSFSNWDNTLMMTFKDLNKSYLFKINMDRGIELVEGYDEEAGVQVNFDSTIFLKMMTKQINPIKAYSSGGLEVKGQMKNLLKLRKLMF